MSPDEHDHENDHEADVATTTSSPSDPVRLDKWLWAARLFKTRALAAEAVQGGKVHLNGARTKPAKPIRPGDTLDVQRGPTQMTIEVRALSSRRGPASEAMRMYSETEASRTRRARDREARAAHTAAMPIPQGRPSKKQRRDFSKLKRW